MKILANIIFALGSLGFLITMFINITFYFSFDQITTATNINDAFNVLNNFLILNIGMMILGIGMMVYKKN